MQYTDIKITTAIITGFMYMHFSSDVLIELDCTIPPIPNEARIQKTENITAIIREPKPFSIYIIGPLKELSVFLFLKKMLR